MSIDNHEEREFQDRARELDELDLDAEENWLELDGAEEEEDISLVSDLFRQISQEAPVNQDSIATPDSDVEERPPIEASEMKESSMPESPRFGKGYLIGAGLAIAIAIIGLIALERSNRQPEPAATIASGSAKDVAARSENLQNVAISELSRIASQKFAQGDLNGATKALETLLDRNALPEAQRVISAIPSGQIDTAQMSFLRGRLIWQSAKGKSDLAEIRTARKYWEDAVKKNPSSVLYGNALGFAYYTEGNFNEAVGAWFGAISAGESAGSPASDKLIEKQVLNNYAGIALGLWRVADSQPPAQKQELTREAVKLGKKVILRAEADYTTERLSQDWMWSKTAIDDWRSFLQQESLI